MAASHSRSSEDSVIGLHGEALKVKVTAPPAGGKANQRLRELLAGTLNVGQSDIEIIRGHTSRRKVLRIWNVTPEQVRESLHKAIGAFNPRERASGGHSDQ